MSKHWNPPRQTAKLRPSRIRRDPLLVPALPAAKKKRDWRSTQWERNFAIAGIVLFAMVIAVSTLAFSAFTAGLGGSSSDQGKRFGQCYNTNGGNCVVDGETIYVDGEKMKIAGIQAPRIDDARCDAERSRGIDTAVRLAALLNRGPVTAGRPFRDRAGDLVRHVEVDGQDLGEAMVAAGMVRGENESSDWCS